MKKLILPLLSLFIIASNVDARLWTNQVGRSFDGEFIEINGGDVTIRRKSDRRKFTMAIANLSQADQDYIKSLDAKKDDSSSEDSLPTTAEELAKWIVGTEWRTSENSGDKLSRFLPDGKMATQRKTGNWDKKLPPRDRKYKVVSATSIKYGESGYIATFNEKFTKMEIINTKGQKGWGKLLRRFEFDSK